MASTMFIYRVKVKCSADEPNVESANYKGISDLLSLVTEVQVDTEAELAVMSVVPAEPVPAEWRTETRHRYHYLVTTDSRVVFFSQIYSTVYCLDMSPSASAVDIQDGEVMLDEIVDVLTKSLNEVVRPVKIPGAAVAFEPQIFVTVIVHTPFFTTPNQQVLVQGWQVTPDNLCEFLAAIRKQLQLLEDTISEVSALAYDQIEAVRIRQMESEKLVGGLFEECEGQGRAHAVPMVGPDSGYVNLLRYGMLALRLLPRASHSNLVVVTDGVMSVPDAHVTELVLAQLRANAVAVSFLAVGTGVRSHPHGLVPYDDLMRFVARATFGAYIPLHEDTPRNPNRGGLNIYHEAFLTWSFSKGANTNELTMPVPHMGEWFFSNQSLYGSGEPLLLLKKQTEDNLNASLASVLCCRLHEGYMIKCVSVKEGQLEIVLILPWANHIYIEYKVFCDWPIQQQNTTRFIVSIKAPYEFLHDVTCLAKKQFESPYRQAVVSRFWTTLETLAQSDLLAAHLDSFGRSATALPDTVRNGVPLFYLPSDNGAPALSSSEPSCAALGAFWRPVCLLAPSVWHRWLHTTALSLLLRHDQPLPRFLHVASPNGRFQGLICRHAASTLYNFLKDWTSFVLIENHSYVKFLSASGGVGPSWFAVVRVQQMAPPSAVVHVAFLGGTPPTLRSQILEQLREKISSLAISQRLAKKESVNNINMAEGEGYTESQVRSNVRCCILLNKPLEKIMIRYEKMPSEFGTVVFPDGTQPQGGGGVGVGVTTLSRYLHHRRWVWTVGQLGSTAACHRILSSLTRMRLQEGFRFAHSTAGIINMVLEIQMKCCDRETDHMCENCRPSIIQYVLFPLHIVSQTGKGSWSSSEEEEKEEEERSASGGSGGMELVAECWIEPQHGVVAGPGPRYMLDLPYHRLADVIWKRDAECITSLLTFEQLRLLSQEPPPPRMDPLETQPRNPLENWPDATALSDQRIQRIPFAYNVVSVLPESQQIELQFPMFIQDFGGDRSLKNNADGPNILFMDTLFRRLKDLHDKDMMLSAIESKLFVELILQRERDTRQHPVPFPRRHSSDSYSRGMGSGRKMSDEDVKKTEKEEELLEMESEDGDSSIGVARSNLCGPLYRMYACDPSSVPQTQPGGPDASRWKFFIKRSSASFVILTFVPASYRDCKILMLGAEPKDCTLLSESSNLDPVKGEEEAEADGVTDDRSSQTSDVRGWILDDVADSVSNVFDPDSSISDLQNLHNLSTWELDEGISDPGSPFRLRARSWEPVKPRSVVKTKKHSSPRARTNSVDSKSRKWNENKLRKRLLCSFDSISMISSNAHSTKLTLGSVDIPVYVYGCSLDNLINSLILKSEYIRDFQDLYWKRSPLGVQGSFETDDTYNEQITHDPALTQEHEVRQHVELTRQAFDESFCVSLFKSLRLGHSVHSKNVQSVIEECEQASVEIDLTDYIQTVCGHLKETPTAENDASRHSPPTCQQYQYRRLHRLIKNKFHRIITASFKPVPSEPDYFYFCSPGRQRGHKAEVDINMSLNTSMDEKRNLDHTQELDSSMCHTELIEFRSDQGSIIGGQSSVSLTEESEEMDVLEEEVSPLFLRLVCRVSANPPRLVRSLPTCLGDVVDQERVRVGLRASLDLVCLMPSAAADHRVAPGHTEAAESDHRCNTGLDALQNLPNYQHKAVSLCVKEIRWMLRDETAAMLLDGDGVTETTLRLVADHVAAGDSTTPTRPNCVVSHVPLRFVLGADAAMPIFLQDLMAMRVPGYCLKKAGELFYLAKDSQPPATTPTNTPNTTPTTTNTEYGEDLSNNSSQKVSMEAEVEAEGWSSVSAWHAQVTQLMEEGSIAFQGSEEFQEPKGECGDIDSDWLWLTELEVKRQELPNFWLVLKVNPTSVILFFHFRFLELETRRINLYSLVKKNIISGIKTVCKTVNQKMLLNNLHDTRMCDKLLEPETVHTTQIPSIGHPSRPEQVSDGDPPGWLTCPVVWQTDFALHPRLKTGTGHGGPSLGLSHGIRALRTVLNRFSVNNRKNMFVYRDSSGNVFYLRLYENSKTVTRPVAVEGGENSPGSISRSSSVNSLNNTGARKPDETLSVTSATKKVQRSRLKSFGEVGDNVRHEQYVTLKVHGISVAGVGSEVKNDLVQVLQNRLDDAVLSVLSVALGRNPHSKLAPYDVRFLQPLHKPPDATLRFTVPPEALDNIRAVLYYLRQNLMEFLHIPKYTDTRPQFHFQDYSQPEGLLENQVYLYNQSAALGNKGMACVAVAAAPTSASHLPAPAPTLTPAQFNVVTTANPVQHSDDVFGVEFRVWKRGRVNVESLALKLKSAVRHSLWDFTTELRLLAAPLELSLSSPDVYAYDECGVEVRSIVHLMAPWMQFGHKLGAPAVTTHVTVLSRRHTVETTLKEMSNLVSGDGTETYVFSQRESGGGGGGGCLLIGRDPEEWLHPTSSPPPRNQTNAPKLLQKFSPYTGHGDNQCVPRQRFLIAIVNNEKIIVHTYNWAKEPAEALAERTGRLGQWLAARALVHSTAALQKCGLFLHQPVARVGNPFASYSGDVDSLVEFASGGRPRTSVGSNRHRHLEEALRDVQPHSRCMSNDADPVVSAVRQLLDAVADNKRGQQKKLYSMWQSRGVTPTVLIADDVLQVFMFFSRVIHYCVTPLLFLPRWRIQSASTRDFSLKAHKNLAQTTQDTVNVEEKWHETLCADFVNEYKQYLQSLGFIPVQVVPATHEKGLNRTTDEHICKEEKTVCLLQKCLLGGILLFELCLSEPFFNARLYALECSKLEGKASSGLISQFTLSFLDESDKVKVLMHVHSMTYDYHVRTLCRHLTHAETLPLLPAGYRVAGFLDDFLKYYAKAPNYACTLVRSGTLVIGGMWTPAHQLFNYLLSHEEEYPLRVVRAASPDDGPLGSDSEYVLVRRMGGADRHHTTDTILVVFPTNDGSSTLKLRYFILLTSHRERNTKVESEKKMGKFRTVSAANPVTCFTLCREATPPIAEETTDETAPAVVNDGAVQIKPESVNYLGYYSSHEQLMQKLILDQEQVARLTLEEIITKVSLHFRTQFLWNKLTSFSSVVQSTCGELVELLSGGVALWPAAELDARLGSALGLERRPAAFYRGLLRLLAAKHPDRHRSLVASDLHKQFLIVVNRPDGFLLLTIDSESDRGELSIVTNQMQGGKKKETSPPIPILLELEEAINACCFHVWTALL